MALCTPWIDGVDVAECCNLEDCDTPALLDASAEIASELLFQYSARQFPGVCEATARPCRTSCGCPWQILSRGHIVWNYNMVDPLYGLGYGFWSCGGDSCGCTPLSRVLLAGHVTAVLEVVIDGAIVDPATYRVDQFRWLTRVRETEDDPWPHWPGCQDMTLPETEPGTWAVTYQYGRDVPAAGVEAAKQLACEVFKQCSGASCALPANTMRVARQGIVVEKPAFIQFAYEKGGRSIPRGWHTGMPAVDQFLSAYNPTGMVRVPIVWTPTARLRYAPTLGLPTAST